MNCMTTSVQRGGVLVPMAPMIVSKSSALQGISFRSKRLIALGALYAVTAISTCDTAHRLTDCVS